MDAAEFLFGNRSLDVAEGAATVIHDKMAASHPKLRCGTVWCLTCGASQSVNSANALRSGWPKCCGHTMTIDSPDERP